MKVSEFTEQYLKKLNEKEKSQFTTNAHKAFNAYVNYVDSHDPSVKDVYMNIDKLYEEYKKQYSSNTVRNYCRYLQLALFLDQVKTEFTSSEFEETKTRINKLVKEADKLSNNDHKKKKDKKTKEINTIETPVLESVEPLQLEDITINDGLSELSEKLSELETLKNDNEHLRHVLLETQHKVNLETQLKEVYKAELDRMYKLLELVHIK